MARRSDRQSRGADAAVVSAASSHHGSIAASLVRARHAAPPTPPTLSHLCTDSTSARLERIAALSRLYRVLRGPRPVLHAHSVECNTVTSGGPGEADPAVDVPRTRLASATASVEPCSTRRRGTDLRRCDRAASHTSSPDRAKDAELDLVCFDALTPRDEPHGHAPRRPTLGQVSRPMSAVTAVVRRAESDVCWSAAQSTTQSRGADAVTRAHTYCVCGPASDVAPSSDSPSRTPRGSDVRRWQSDNQPADDAVHHTASSLIEDDDTALDLALSLGTTTAARTRCGGGVASVVELQAAYYLGQRRALEVWQGQERAQLAHTERDARHALQRRLLCRDEQRARAELGADVAAAERGLAAQLSQLIAARLRDLVAQAWKDYDTLCQDERCAALELRAVAAAQRASVAVEETRRVRAASGQALLAQRDALLAAHHTHRVADLVECEGAVRVLLWTCALTTLSCEVRAAVLEEQQLAREELVCCAVAARRALTTVASRVSFDALCAPASPLPPPSSTTTTSSSSTTQGNTLSSPPSVAEPRRAVEAQASTPPRMTPARGVGHFGELASADAAPNATEEDDASDSSSCSASFDHIVMKPHGPVFDVFTTPTRARPWREERGRHTTRRPSAPAVAEARETDRPGKGAGRERELSPSSLAAPKPHRVPAEEETTRHFSARKPRSTLH